MSITDQARRNREYVRRRLAENSPEFAAVLGWLVWELARASDTETEHTVIEPLVAAIDAAAVDPDHGYQRFGRSCPVPAGLPVADRGQAPGPRCSNR